MLALGCFIPLVTLAVGAGLGSYLGDIHGGYVGAATGLVVGVVIVAAAFMLLGRTRSGD